MDAVSSIDDNLEVLIKLKYPTGFGFDPYTLEDLLTILRDLSAIDKIDLGNTNTLISFYVNPLVFKLLLPRSMVKVNKNTNYYQDFTFRNSPHISSMCDICYRVFEDQISRPYSVTSLSLRTVVLRDRRQLNAISI